jgi:hypothetical protein
VGVRWKILRTRSADAGDPSVTRDPNSPLQETPPSPVQGNLPPADGRGGSATALRPPPRRPQASRQSGVGLWLHRLLILLFVFLCAAVGVLLVIVPWTPQWTDNYLLLRWSGLRTFVSNGFVRGLCSGLGVLDIWIGFREAAHYHEAQQP